VAASIEIQVPLGAVTPERFLASGAPLPSAFRAESLPGSTSGPASEGWPQPGGVAEPTGAVAGTPITAAHVRDLHTPPGGSVSFFFTDDAGTLQAVATLRELRHAARRGCPSHPDGTCGCAVLTWPESTDAYAPTAAQRRFLTTRDRSCRHPGCDNRAGWADADHVVPHADGGPTDCANLASCQDTAARSLRMVLTT
jgi:hypothetical protein